MRCRWGSNAQTTVHHSHALELNGRNVTGTPNGMEMKCKMSDYRTSDSRALICLPCLSSKEDEQKRVMCVHKLWLL